MTFTTKIKDEITKIFTSIVESQTELLIYLKISATIKNEEISIFVENASVARRVFKLLKETYAVNINLTIRTQKKFRKKVIYILSITEKITEIIKDIESFNKLTLDSFEEKSAFLKGAFLACGSINDPKSGIYHAEFLIKNYKDAILINKILQTFGFNSKYIKREKGYMIYLKSAEEISDLIKILGATSALFYFEDIRIYRDHKNMVNRLNNMEQANTDKIISAAQEQIKKINYLKEKKIFDLLEPKTKMILEYRLKYPDSSFQELAEIISLETENKISKSGINHHFRNLNELFQKHE